MSDIYRPREDSFLFLRVIDRTNLEGLTILDMGTGSGILAIECARRGAKVTAVDIDENAVRALKSLARKHGVKIEVLQSNLFSNVFERYDLILFNPPYLPSGPHPEDIAVDGGFFGRELVEEFLRLMPQHLKKRGLCLLLISSLNVAEKLTESFSNLSFRQVEAERLFFETLIVYEITLKTN